jgi:short-chain fatty acids transporter
MEEAYRKKNWEQQNERGGIVLRALSNVFVRIMERWMPDPYIFATLLTMLTYILALIFTKSGPIKLVELWAQGLWGLLVFTMQISIALVFSSAIIRSKPVEKLLKWGCGFATSPAKAYYITCFMGGLGSLFSWASGLIVGAFVAKEMAKNVKGCHYPLLVASGYSGFVIWHMGYTSSVGLIIATPGHFLEKMMGVIPTSMTIFSTYNMATALFLLVTTPYLMMKLAPDAKDVKEVDPCLFESASCDETEKKDKSMWTPADWMENARIINLVLGVAGVIYMFLYYSKGGGLTMDSTNMSFLTMALLLNRTPKEFVVNCVEGGKSLGPIVQQFPLYGGIMGMMVKSGLASVIASWFVAISTPFTLPFWSFMSAGIINMFVPSGGSQWAVQGPIMVEAAKQMGVDVGRISMAVAWGDQWTNMLQPFWALPLLAIVGMKARDIMGYCTMTLIWSGIAFAIGITMLPQ